MTFTFAFNPICDNLLKASKEATTEGVKQAGIDVRLGELGGIIGEILNSYEVEIKGKTYPVKAIEDLCGHTMDRFRIHGGKSVPLYRDDSSESSNVKMEDVTVFLLFISSDFISIFTWIIKLEKENKSPLSNNERKKN